MKLYFLACLALAAPLTKRGLSDIVNAAVEEFYYTNSDFSFEFIKLAINRLGDGFLDNLVLPESTTLTVALPPDSSLLSLLSNSNEEIRKFITYHVFYNQTVNYTSSASYQSVQGSYAKLAIDAVEQTTTYLSSYDKPSLVLGNAILLDGKVELLFLNDSIIVPDSIYQTGQYYSWTNLTNFIAVASKQEPFVLNATSTLSKETELEIPGFGTVIIPFGNTYLIPSESALQEFALLNCNGAERRILDFHTLSNQTYFANSFTNTTANFTESIKVVAVNGSVLFQGPYNSAKVVQADILVEGGVGHVVDAVLLPFASCSI